MQLRQPKKWLKSECFCSYIATLQCYGQACRAYVVNLLITYTVTDGDLTIVLAIHLNPGDNASVFSLPRIVWETLLLKTNTQIFRYQSYQGLTAGGDCVSAEGEVMGLGCDDCRRCTGTARGELAG